MYMQIINLVQYTGVRSQHNKFHYIPVYLLFH